MRAFITGITGTLGRSVTRDLLSRGHEVIGYSRCELKQSQIPPRGSLTLYLGDVRDRARLLEATRDVDIIFHFAALKHVDMAETNPEEYIKTNINGTMNVLHCQRIHSIPKVIFTSTDKAVEPINLYGYTKAVGEKLILRNPKNSVVRYGNVLASRGSVVPKFVESLMKERKVYITDMEMTRFWITVDHATNMVRTAAGGYDLTHTGADTIFLPNDTLDPKELIVSAHVCDVARAIASILSISDFKFIVTGIRPGEKIHEKLDSDLTDSNSNAFLITDPDELVALLEPIVRELGP